MEERWQMADDMVPDGVQMNVNISIELSERQKALAEEQMRNSGFDTLSAYFASLIESDSSSHDPVADMRDVIRQRLTLPDDQWLSSDEFWAGFEARRKARIGK
jgi:hypothetical protein